MDVRFLRIGNRINYRIDDHLDERKSFDEESVIDIESLSWLQGNPDDPSYKGIPFDETQAVRVGMEKAMIGHPVYEIKGGPMNVIRIRFKQGKCLVFVSMFSSSVFLKEINYLHEFQNIYSEITGIELQFK